MINRKEWSEYDRGLELEFMRVPQGARAVFKVVLKDGKEHELINIYTPEFKVVDRDDDATEPEPMPDSQCHLVRFRWYPFGRVPLEDDSPFDPVAYAQAHAAELKKIQTAPEIEDEMRSAHMHPVHNVSNYEIPGFTQITVKYLQMIEDRMNNAEKQYHHLRGFMVGSYVMASLEWLIILGLFFYVALYVR